MNGTDLLAKASKAGYDYRAIYGAFPEKIGIHAQQLGLLPFVIFFPEPPPIELFTIQQDVSKCIDIKRHETRFEPVMGEDIHPDEVYLPIPGSPYKCVSGEFVAKLAKEFE